MSTLNQAVSDTAATYSCTRCPSCFCVTLSQMNTATLVGGGGTPQFSLTKFSALARVAPYTSHENKRVILCCYWRHRNKLLDGGACRQNQKAPKHKTSKEWGSHSREWPRDAERRRPRRDPPYDVVPNLMTDAGRHR